MTYLVASDLPTEPASHRFRAMVDHGDDSRQILTQELLCPDAEATLTPRYCGACDLDKSAEDHRGL